MERSPGSEGQGVSEGTAEIAKAVASVMAELPSLPRDGHNAFSNYEFTTESMIANTLRPMMAKAGLALVPFNSEITHSEDAAGKKGDMSRVTISGQYKLIHTSGESLSVVVPGEGMDSLDKSTAKALTQSMKYALLQIFCAGRGEDGDTGRGYDRHAPISENAAVRQAASNSDTIPGYVFTFGKHEGKSIRAVDSDYLKWLIARYEEDLKDKSKARFAGNNKMMLDTVLAEINRRASNAVADDGIPFDGDIPF